MEKFDFLIQVWGNEFSKFVVVDYPLVSHNQLCRPVVLEILQVHKSVLKILLKNKFQWLLSFKKVLRLKLRLLNYFWKEINLILAR